MQIRDIRLEQFGAWEHVDISKLSPGVNVILLDDGARAIDFSRFLHEMLVGFPEKRGQTTAGSITFLNQSQRRDKTWRLERQARDGEQSWQIQRDRQAPFPDPAALRAIQGSLQGEEIDRLFIPKSNNAAKPSRWQWLAKRPDILRPLMPTQTTQAATVHDHAFLKTAAEFSLKPHGRVLMDLAKQRDTLIERIAQSRADIDRLQSELGEAKSIAAVAEQSVRMLQAAKDKKVEQRVEPVVAAPVKRPTPTPAPHPVQVNRDLIADLTEELRRIRLQLPLLQRAVELTDRWQEYQKLSNANQRHEQAVVDLDLLRTLLAEHQLLEEEKQDFQKTLVKQTRHAKRSTRPKRKRKRTDEYTVRRLLDQRNWVTEAAATPALVAFDVSNEQHDEIRHAAHLLITARRDHQRAQRRFAEFSMRTQFDWSRLFEDPIAARASAIASDSPIQNEPPEKRLLELKRRRLWVREELRCLMEHSSMPLVVTWLAILFTLSICAILGTLLMSSHGGQWFTLTFGLAGMVSSGALKLSIDFRATRRLNSVKDRLRQIDAEILSLTEQTLDAKKDAQAIRRIASERLHALQLHHDAVATDRRLDGAEASYHELLDELGLPLALAPEEIDRTLRRRESKLSNLPDDERRGEHSKLRKWIKRARDTVERIDGVRPGKDPLELLSTLEAVFDHIRDREHEQDRAARVDRERKAAELSKSEFERRLQREARDGIKRVERRQKSLLRKAKVEDQFALERKIQAAEDDEARVRRMQRLENELRHGVNLYEDPDELTELLDSVDAESLRLRLVDITRRRDELTSQLKQVEAATELAQVEAPEPIEEQQVEEQLVKELPKEEQPDDEELEKVTSDHQAALKRVTDVLKLRDEHQHKLDAMRLQLAMLESKLRKAMTWSQQSAAVRQIARVMLDRPRSSSAQVERSPWPFLSELTNGRWNWLIETPQGLAVESRAGEKELVESQPDSNAIWLAVQLAAASQRLRSGETLPLALLADELLNAPNAAQILSVLQDAADAGIQSLLLTSDPQLANQLAEIGTPMVRIGLQEQAGPLDDVVSTKRKLAA